MNKSLVKNSKRQNLKEISGKCFINSSMEGKIYRYDMFVYQEIALAAVGNCYLNARIFHYKRVLCHR